MLPKNVILGLLVVLVRTKERIAKSNAVRYLSPCLPITVVFLPKVCPLCYCLPHSGMERSIGVVCHDCFFSEILLCLMLVERTAGG